MVGNQLNSTKLREINVQLLSDFYSIPSISQPATHQHQKLYACITLISPSSDRNLHLSSLISKPFFPSSVNLINDELPNTLCRTRL